MDDNGHAAISCKLMAAAAVVTTGGAFALPALASALVGQQLEGVTEQTVLNQAAVRALAACQQALLMCAEDQGTGEAAGAIALASPSTSVAFEAVVAGANELGKMREDGLVLLVNRVLPTMAQAIVDHDGERRIHGIVLAFLLGLAQGAGRRRPAAGIEGGILLAFPFPEPRMR